MVEEFRRPQDSAKIFRDLNEKFAHNLGKSLACDAQLLDNAERQARDIADVGSMVSQQFAQTIHHREMASIFSEVFADLICSIYLSSIGLDRPAETVLRRALELGVSVVFLWDCPHIYFGWKCHDKDLSFTEMLSHLDSAPYKSFLKAVEPTYEGKDILNSSDLQRIYRHLSNTIHGKLASFEVVLPDRYSHSPADWHTHLELVISVEKSLLQLWRARFPRK
jgi:hypothetical protein